MKLNLRGLLIFFVMSHAHASIDSDLNNFFDQLGYSGNITSAEAYQGQSAGYYTGGSVFERNTVRNTQIASMQLPSFRGGCGGIDLFTGGFSYVNSQEFIQALKNIANNASSYAFMLAVETVSPLIAEQMKNLQSISNTINQTNINSCEMGASLVGGLWPKTDMAQKHVCESVGTSNNLFADWAQARQGCGAGGQRASTLTQGKHDTNFKDMVFDNVNLAWRAIQKNEFLAKDPELSELFMSLSGSVIFKRNGNDDNAPSQLVYLPSLSHHATLLHALLTGGQASMYRCKDTTTHDCLDVTQQIITIDVKHALAHRVRALLQDMVDRIQTDTKLTDEEIGLLQSTPLPVYKMLNVNVAYAKGSPVLDVAQYSDVIASDILYQYLTENVGVVMTSAAVLPLPEEIMKQFKEDLMEARRQVAEERRKTTNNINVALEMIQRTQVLEQQLAGLFSTNFSP